MRLHGGRRFLAFGSALLAATSALAQQNDPPGTGILCGYDIVAAVIVDAEVCGWIDTDRGRAVKQVFADMGAYILANDPSYPERVTGHEEGVERAVELTGKFSPAEKTAFCAGTNPDHPNYFIAMRDIEADTWLKNSRESLSIPAMPTYGVCF